MKMRRGSFPCWAIYRKDARLVVGIYLWRKEARSMLRKIGKERYSIRRGVWMQS